MVQARLGATLGVVSRLLLFCNQPHHLSAAEADGWLRDQVAQLELPETVERIELTRLRAAASGHPSPGDWLCELHIGGSGDPRACLDDPACAEWLRDLRLLGMRPAIAVDWKPGFEG